MTKSVLDSLLEALAGAAAYNRDDVAAPAALLWPDAEREWQEAAPRLGARYPILTLGEYAPAQRTGPAFWIRCMLARALPEADWADDVIPVVYLPGVSRADLRATEDAPSAVQPLAELQYRGLIWSQRSGRDWSVAAFLQSAYGGLGIPVAGDAATQDALRRALLVLLDEPVDRLRANAPLRADFLNALLAPDLPRQVLLWIDDPEGTPAKLGGAAWDAFCAQCRQDLGVDPEGDGALAAAERLGLREGPWEGIWQRFREAPTSYPQIPERLRQARPTQTSFVFEDTGSESWPQDNEAREDDLRDALTALAGQPQDAARAALAQLEARHGFRRDWIWSDLGRSPLAAALKPLSELAERTTTPLAGPGLAELAEHYATQGWRVDDAALRAMACVRTSDDLKAIAGASSALYKPWLRGACEVFQAAWGCGPEQSTTPVPAPGTALLFSDGLRMDLGRRLAERLGNDGLLCQVAHTFAAVPTITGTAKPAVSPVAGLLGAGDGLAPATPQGTPLSPVAFRKLLGEQGIQCLSPDETGDPSGAAWTEVGHIDEIGHNDGWRLAFRADDELDGIARRVGELLDAGWHEVRILTDHGWFLMPENLDTYHLPEQATEVRKGRCARLKPGAQTTCQVVPWRWAPDVAIAIAPDMRCFVGGKPFEHGGISPQEVVVPVLSIRGTKPRPTVSIGEAKWVGLRCRVRLVGAFEGLAVDLRTKPIDPSTSVAEAPRAVSEGGSTSLVCPDDAVEGSAAVLVVYSAEAPQKVLAQRPTVVGSSDDGSS